MPEDVAKMIESWNSKTIVMWAKEFEISYQAVIGMIKIIRREDRTLCPKRIRTKIDVAKAGITLYKQKHNKEKSGSIDQNSKHHQSDRLFL